jgi:hypothetical protein
VLLPVDLRKLYEWLDLRSAPSSSVCLLKNNKARELVGLKIILFAYVTLRSYSQGIDIPYDQKNSQIPSP